MDVSTERTDLPTCPGCGRVDHDWWDGRGVNDEYWVVECAHCGIRYTCVAYRTISFTTTRAYPHQRTGGSGV